MFMMFDTTVARKSGFAFLVLALITVSTFVAPAKAQSSKAEIGLVSPLIDVGNQPVSIVANESQSTSLDDTQWISQWSTPGIDLYGLDLAMSDEGLIVGGLFARAGDEQVTSIARWDPAQGTWHGMNGGVLDGSFIGTINAVAVDGDVVYVGGNFDTAGGVAAENIAMYNLSTSTWSALGAGVDNTVNDIVISGSNVFVGGRFDNAGGAPAANIARWDGSSWSTLGTGMSNDVNVLTLFNNELYAGGSFTTAGAVSANRIARWDGVNWHALSDGVGDGFNSTVTALQGSGSTLYVGGNFTEAAGTTGFNYVAAWNSGTSTYSPLGTGFTNAVTDLAYDGSSLFATGVFEESGINDVNFLAEWNGTTWNDVDGGLWAHQNSGIAGQALLVDGTDLYVSGFFAGAGSTPAVSIARRDLSANAWHALGSGQNTAPVGTSGLTVIWDVLAIDDAILAGGSSFEFAGDIYASGIAMWDETSKSWSDLGGVTSSGETGVVYDMVLSGDHVYVGGIFDNAGGVAANNVAMYDLDTQSWSALGDGVDGTVQALFYNSGSLYAGGSFSNAGGNPASRIAVWNGSTWSALGTGTSGTIYDIEQYNNEIYVGGGFNTAGGITASNIAKWNGVNWSALDDGVGEGTNSSVREMVAVGDTILYFGGFFTDAGGVTGVNRVASWNNSTSSFSALGTGFDGPVYAVHNGPDGQIYAAGVMATSGLTDVNNVAVWNGTVWGALGSGTDYEDVGGGAVAIETSSTGNDLYFGGVFAFTGNKVNQNLARYNLAPNTSVENPELPDESSTVLVDSYPNPFSASTTIDVQLREAGNVSIEVFDLLGRRVETLVDNRSLPSGKQTFVFNGSHLENGLYFYRVSVGGVSTVGSMTLVK